MEPPDVLNVLDKHNGFTAVTKLNGRSAPSWFVFRNLSEAEQNRAVTGHRYNTFWRTALVPHNEYAGELVAYNERSFYQNNDDVTIAFYHVPWYQYLVACWFDNKTGERIA